MTDLRERLKGKAELGVALGLAVMAVIVGWDTITQRSVSLNIGILGPRVVPTIIAIGLAVCAIAIAIDVMRGHHAADEESEDIDPNQSTAWGRLALIAAILVLAGLLLPSVGFVATTIVMIFAIAVVLGSRQWIVLAIVSIALPFGVYYGFAYGLGIVLPAGILTGIL